MRSSHKTILVLVVVAFLVACANLAPRKGWNRDFGPVVPHDTFPGDCSICHESGSWNKIKPDFTYDHLKETGVALNGAHATAQCLMCHNDRGPVKQFADRGCGGCHEDVHRARLGLRCQDCHNERTWKPEQAIAAHSKTRFPLVGAHAAATCTTCHPRADGGDFVTPSTSCESCHAKDAARSTVVDHAALGLSDRCDRCHNAVSFLPAKFSHPDTFPLTGGHGNSNCTACHTTPGVFTGLSTDCVSCHLADYQATTNPNHLTSGMNTNCVTCHTTTQWEGATFVHPQSFPLTDGHANRQCSDCHRTPGVFTGLSTTCSTCHMADFQRTTNPNHAAAGFSTDCTQCHHTTLQFQGASFQHTSTFPLTNGHANRACTACHTTPGVYTGQSTACVSCHQADYNSTTSPAHAAAGFGTNCVQCHSTTQWLGAVFTHPSTFPLTNSHAGRACTDCHRTPGVYTGLSTTCVSCHLTNYQGTTNPNHITAGYGTDCAQCHNTFQWLGAFVTHPATFPLTQGHAGVSCSACHTTPGVFTGLSTACASCHLSNYQSTTSPNHAAANISTDCTQCHTTRQWPGATFPHTAAFPLTNGHAGHACTTCHTTPNVYTGLSGSDCVHCHLSDFQRTTNPNHVTSGFATTCADCHHSTIQFQGASFQHPATFPLTNGHSNVACTMCHHTPGVYTGNSTACSSCHLADYQRTTAPYHAAAGISTTCNQCHNTTQWVGATFPHSATFPLTSGHAGRQCSECHRTPGVYTGQSTACVACHLATYQGASAPNHITAGFGTDCATCHHSTAQWIGAVFNHPSTFPLTNGHAGRNCTDCHRTPGVYTGLSTACVSCHQANYNATTNPNHAAAGFSTVCQTCHLSTAQWTGATFTHTSTFPLTNGHSGRVCSDCHRTPGVYTGLSTACQSCHLANYNATTSPAHAAAGFGTDCATCHHSTAQWLGATFNHPSSFPLTNGHAGRTCNACHRTPGVYTGLSTTCVSCHLTDYQGATNPNHSTLGYPQVCTLCHNTTLWTNATFNHPRVNRGNHSNLRCVDCHTVPAATPAYVCTACHTHSQSAMASRHQGRSGYQWISSYCYNCHY